MRGTFDAAPPLVVIGNQRENFPKQMDRFKIRGQISSGAHGVVYRAVRKGHLNTGSTNVNPDQLLAIKRIFVRKKKMPLQLLREIKSLQLLSGHENIIELLDVFSQDSSANLVFPLFPVNLSHLIYEESLDTYQRLAYSFMIFNGIKYIHEKGLIHRDIKPANLIIDWSGVLKICDFGQARMIPDKDDSASSQMSHQVCTRWYRAPELLYGSTSYDRSVDIWSAGCSVAEIFMVSPLFPGESDIEQLFMVISSLGPPSVEWASPLPDYNKITFNIKDEETGTKATKWKEDLLSRVQIDDVFDLILRTCGYTERLTALQVLNHICFSELLRAGIDQSRLYHPEKESASGSAVQ